jgi:phage tail-like protein
MDVQGSQYHLISGLADWSECVDVAIGDRLGDLWRDELDDGPSGPGPSGGGPSGPPRLSSAWEYDAKEGWIRLRRDTPLFRRAGRSEPMNPAGRRGAGRDGHGNWYWIDTDERTIRWLPAAERAADLWWAVDELHRSCTCLTPATPDAGFRNARPCPASGARLSGLAVTTGHYLVVGYAGDGEAGLLLFDLQAGGAPLRLLWPPSEGFAPLDICELADGGLLVLDSEHSCYWRLDEHFRVRGTERSRTGAFRGTDGSGPLSYPLQPDTRPYRLAASDGAPLHPISIEPGPAGSTLVMDANPTTGYSILYCFDGEMLRWTSHLREIVEVIDPADETNTTQRYSLLGYDFVYLATPPATGPLAPPMLYVADSEGDQVVAFTVDEQTGELSAQDDFLPLRRWAGRALVRGGEGAWYDFGERWIPLAVFTECRFASEATLVTPVPSGTLPGEPFDSQKPGCVWHRLLLDAFVPTGTSIRIRARAADEITLLEFEPWVDQPVPYQRSDGAELPWADVWADQRDPSTPIPPEMGTYELLFQSVIGRYCQLEVSLFAGGRSSATIRSIRVWFPRFSYVETYLPALYAEHDLPDRFLERLLANPEGILTALEEKIEHSHLLLDARTAREADLPWLASWFGLVLDPLWTPARRRFLIHNVDAFYRRRGTVAGLLAILRVFFDDERALTGHSIFAVGAVPSTSTRIRLVERFLTRMIGPPGAAGTELSIRRAAHRFDVQVPGRLTSDELAIVGRIIEQGKPAHTAFALQPYEELFVVGQARLGLDTELAPSPHFAPVVLGQSLLGRGYLGYARPFDIADRVISDRDRLGRLPAL